jgi:hypothetical protein
MTNLKNLLVGTIGTTLFSLGIVGAAQAATITIESAVLGTTGETGGYSIVAGPFSTQFLGWRFEVDNTLQVTDIGGHLASFGSIFGTLVSLNNPNALPQGSPFLPEEILASTTFVAGFPSSDITTPLSVTLAPGNYALIFGTGLFGATGTGFMPSNNFDLPGASYFIWGTLNPGDSIAWRNTPSGNARFVVRGETVDVIEPSSLLGIGMVLGIGAIRQRNSFRKRNNSAGAS